MSIFSRKNHAATISRELADLADKTADALGRADDPAFAEQIRALEEACKSAKRSWSGSNIGYHANVYYEGLAPTPAGSEFVPEWGLLDRWPTHQPDPGWRIMDPSDVVDCILAWAKISDLPAIEKTMNGLRDELSDLKEHVVSMLNAAISERSDPFLKRQLATVEGLKVATPDIIAPTLFPHRGWSRDSEAVSQGAKVAPHQQMMAVYLSQRVTRNGLETLEKAVRLAADHIDRTAGIKAKKESEEVTGTNSVQATALRMLKSVYELSTGRPEGAELEHVADQLGIGEGEAQVAWNYLAEKGLIKRFSIPTIATPTAKGTETIENALAHPNTGSPIFGGVTINNITIQHMSGSAIQQGGAGAVLTQQITFNAQDRADLAELADLLEDADLTSRLNEPGRRKLAAQIATIKAQLQDEPDATVMQQVGRTVRNITEGAIASLIAAGLQPELWQWAHTLIARLAG